MIKNYAIARSLTIDFDNRLTILSGETGAGKSILIGALSLILGERASSETVRSGKDLAVVEAEISDIPRSAIMELRNLDVDCNGEVLTFRREVQAKGASRAFVNGRMVPLGALKKIAASMFDLVGQHQHQYLTNADHHIIFLDTFAGLTDLCAEMSRLYDLHNDLKRQLDELQADSARQKEMMELYRFQVQEIEQADLSSREEESLLSEKRILENAEMLKTSLGNISTSLVIDDNSVTSRIAQLEIMLKRVSEIDTSLLESHENLVNSRYALEDIGMLLASRAEKMDVDPDRLQEIEERLDTYYDLKKKYGGSLELLNEYYDKIKVDLDSDFDMSSRIESLREQLGEVEGQLADAALGLSEKRRKHAESLSQKIEKELSQLGIAKGRFEVRITRREDENGLIESQDKRYRVERDGIDEVEFYFCANRGEELRPLAKIASGGELSRVMLALKTVGAAKRNLETLIFDEIDSGIGGEVAVAVGRKLRQLSKKHQVLVITHLQQIAAAGEYHYRVYKEKEDDRMVTKIKKLTDNERRKEIGRMLSGDKPTQTALKQADELLSQYEQPKSFTDS